MTLSKRTRWGTTVLVVLAMAIPGVAQAQDEDAPAEEPTTEAPEAGTVLSTIPVLGAGLNLTIERNEDGTIASVAVDPSDGTTVQMEEDHKIVILLGDDDTEVVVKSMDDVVQTKVTADDPVDVSGDGVWTGDVFGTGDVSIPYSITFDGNLPTITVGEITAPADVSATLTEAEAQASDEGGKASYAIGVLLTSGESEAKVTLRTKTTINEEGETSVVVIVTLIYRDVATEAEAEQPETEEPETDESESRSARVSGDDHEAREDDAKRDDSRGDA